MRYFAHRGTTIRRPCDSTSQRFVCFENLYFFPITECMHDFSNCSELQPARKQLCKYSPEAAQQSNQDFGDSLVFPVCSGPKLGGYSSKSFPKWPLAKKNVAFSNLPGCGVLNALADKAMGDPLKLRLQGLLLVFTIRSEVDPIIVIISGRTHSWVKEKGRQRSSHPRSIGLWDLDSVGLCSTARILCIANCK